MLSKEVSSTIFWVFGMTRPGIKSKSHIYHLTVRNFTLSGFSVHTTVWMHHMNANKTYREKMRWELHKNAMYCLQQILKVTSPLTVTVQPPASYLTNYLEHCWRSKDKLISNVHLWTPAHRQTNVGQLTKTFISSVRLPASYLTNHLEHCWRSKDKHISDVHLWTPTHGQANVFQLAKTYISSVQIHRRLASSDGWLRWMVRESGKSILWNMIGKMDFYAVYNWSQ